MKSLILTIKTTFLFILLFVISSCEDKIELELDKETNKIAVDAFLNGLRQEQKIKLTFTDGYFSGMQSPPLMGAEVVVTDLTINKKYQFTDKRDGNYVYNLLPSDTMVISGHDYELSIRYNNTQYRANASCKRSVNIERTFFTYEEASKGLMGNSAAGYKIKLLAKDKIGSTPDFYWIKLFKNSKFYGRPQNMQLESFGMNNESDGQYFNPDRWKTAGPEGDDICSKGDIIRLEIHGISRETYDFLSLGVKMSNNGGMFAVTSVNLPTNIYTEDKNALDVAGFFSISEVSYTEAICP
jgi:hypothetical protein